MADTTKTSLQLSFLNASGAAYTMSFNYPDTDVTALQIETLMALMITKDIILTTGGALTTSRDGGLVTRSFVDLVE